jgi:hypothetical protein
LASPASLGHRGHVFQFKFLELQRSDDDVEVRHGKRRASDLEHVRAQVGDLLLNIKVCTLHDGHDRDERCHTHRQSQDCERGSQLVPAQGTKALS